jgi:hypothetical protein
VLALWFLLCGLPITQGLRFLSLSKSVIEEDDVSLLFVFLRVLGFGHEAIGNVGFFLIFDVVPHSWPSLDTCQAMSPIRPLSELKRIFSFPWVFL